MSREGELGDAGASAAVAPRRLLDAVNVSLPQPEAPRGYGLAMGLLAACLVLLSVSYLALVAFLGWLVGWHVVQAVSSFQYGPYFVFHLPMAVVGGLLLLFLVKPVFFRRKGSDEAVLTLEAADEPVLFDFVRRLCAAGGSVPPAAIEVDCEPNAGARLRRGAVGRGLVLRVGLPLAGALTARQFAGVLCHEFGHFNQRGGMREAYLVRRLNAFFGQVVFQRDRLDAKLARLRRSPNALSRLVYYAAVALVEPARGVLWLMLLAGELLACHALRRMEYDADRAEAHVAGLDDFVRTSQQMVFLQIASARARQDLASAFDGGRLADDLPALVVANARQLAEDRAEIVGLMEKERTGWFDTHPSYGDRVRNAGEVGAAGLPGIVGPAEQLFRDFPGLCRRATEAFYRAAMGGKAYDEGRAKAKTVPAAELTSERSGQRRAGRAMRRYFQNSIVGSRPPFPEAEAGQVPADAAEARRRLEAARARMLAAADPAAAEQFADGEGALAGAAAELALCDAFPRLHPKVVALRQKAAKVTREREPAQVRASQRLWPFEAAARERFTAALQLLQVPEVAAKVREQSAAAAAAGGSDGDDVRETLGPLLTACTALAAGLDEVRQMEQRGLTVQLFRTVIDPQQPHPPLLEQIYATGRDLADGLKRLRDRFDPAPYPFAHGTAGISVGAAVIENLPNREDPVAAHDAAGIAVGRYYTLTYRALAALVEWAERVEQAVGLPPLPEPADAPRDPARIEAERAAAARNDRRFWLGYGGRAAAGVLLVGGLVGLSIAPPSLPAMPWESVAPGRDYAYRPASFRTVRYTETPYRPRYDPYGGIPQPPQPIQPYGYGPRRYPAAGSSPGMPQGPAYDPYTPPERPRAGGPPPPQRQQRSRAAAAAAVATTATTPTAAAATAAAAVAVPPEPVGQFGFVSALLAGRRIRRWWRGRRSPGRRRGTGRGPSVAQGSAAAPHRLRLNCARPPG